MQILKSGRVALGRPATGRRAVPMAPAVLRGCGSPIAAPLAANAAAAGVMTGARVAMPRRSGNRGAVKVQAFLNKLFKPDPSEGTRKKYQARVDAINALEPAMQALTDDQLRAKTAEFKERVRKGESLESILPEAFAVVREGSRRVLGLRPFDVQLIGGMILHEGQIAEMRTGEGKTLVAVLPAYLNALTGRGVHVVTVNDYLARRDSEWVGQVHRFLGLAVGLIQADLKPEARRAAYACDVTYVTNSELGFDYLRDNLAAGAVELVLREDTPFNFCVIDEVDSILIDEARTPLIISGMSDKPSNKYNKVTDLYDPKTQWASYIINALKAKELQIKNVNYIVKAGEVIIVDEFTGRTMPGRRWSDGLHQAVEAKEGLEIQNENITLASVSYQAFFRNFPKLAGMTGTAATEVSEFDSIYKLPVAVVPTNRTIQRKDNPDVVFSPGTQQLAEAAVKGAVAAWGTRQLSELEAEDRLSVACEKGFTADPQLLQLREAFQAMLSEYKAVTEVEKAEVVGLGGLHVIGTERHESRRIDNQLRGRSGRQGDPGSTRFFLSLEDPLFRVFGGDRIKGLMVAFQVEDLPMESTMLSDALDTAQKRVEAYFFRHPQQTHTPSPARPPPLAPPPGALPARNLFDYDQVVNTQRDKIYSERRKALLAPDLAPLMREYAEKTADDILEANVDRNTEVGEWKLDSLAAKMVQYCYLIEGLTGADLARVAAEGGFEGLRSHLHRLCTDAYDRKVAMVDAVQPGLMAEVQKFFAIKFLQQAVGLRGYASKDPLTEFKLEGYNLFVDMTAQIRRNVIYNVYMFQPQRIVPVEEAQAAQQAASGNGKPAEAEASKQKAKARA
ncbi:hypothetical protein GPECTOR_8g291 [Gonium pectorale]|uniref:chloroplast protein-transporting ATPase n=1 Tax=Gonium pectorale TaxID=33097 RepID=A0A150GSX3_GONPE|nr:hypothetical protein GPECTOR_8g291 [Gonium pectorale]|eukprot:KXZ52913.1 hypothetical protein GPECTOR_8g291 [Gonium pectorale]